MSPRRRGQRQGGRQNSGGKGQQGRPANQPQPVEFWRVAPPFDPPAPVTPAADPGAIIRSLGSPPLPGQGAVAEHYLVAVVERAAGLATALAAAGGLLAEDDDDA
jgi:hypothetical protein